MLRDLLTLLWPGSHAPLLDRRRSEAIVRRVRIFAHLFAALTIGWIVIDATVFQTPLWIRLGSARLAAATAFMALALWCRMRPATPRHADTCLALLYAIPATFFVASLQALEGLSHSGLALGVAAAYSFVPFVLAAGIAAFPLNLVEAAMLAAISFAAQAWALGDRGISLSFGHLDAYWLLSLIAVVAAFSSMSQLTLLAELVRQAMRDPLTGCHRRESGKEVLDRQFQLAMRHDTPLTVLFADLDRFKAVNDAFGHEVGDHVLATAAAALRGMIRESDAVLRWGGEEFVVVLPHTTAAEAVALLERLRSQGIGRLPDGRAVTLSIGISESRADAVANAEELVHLADRRMYEAKQAGRNRYVYGASTGARTLLVESTSTDSR